MAHSLVTRPKATSASSRRRHAELMVLSSSKRPTGERDAGWEGPQEAISAGGAAGRDGEQTPIGIDPATGEVLDVEDPPEQDWPEAVTVSAGA